MDQNSHHLDMSNQEFIYWGQNILSKMIGLDHKVCKRDLDMGYNHFECSQEMFL
jgi:hypothetical protein